MEFKHLDFEQEQKIKLFNNWFTCIYFISFDNDEGQVKTIIFHFKKKIEASYPPTMLSKHEEKYLSLISFPDSYSISK